MYNKLLAFSLIIAMVLFASCGGPKERKKMSELLCRTSLLLKYIR